MNSEKEVWILKRNEMEKEMMGLREENKRCFDLIVRLSKDEAEGQRMLKTFDSRYNPYHRERLTSPR